MKTKVLHFIHGLSMGGAETLVKEYCLKLDKEKFDVSVLCFHRYDTPYEKMLEDAGVKVHYLSDGVKDYDKKFKKQPDRTLLILQRCLLLRNYIRKEAPDVIHTHLSISGYVLFANPKKETKVFHTVHNEPKKRWSKRISHRIDFFAAKQLIKKYHMRFITLHEEMRKEVNELFGVQDSLVLNNGIDFSRFENALPKEVVRKQEGIPKDAYVIGHVGRFNAQKNHSLLIKAFYEIQKNKENAFLLLIGHGDLMDEVKQMIVNLRIENKTKILTKRPDVPDLMNAMDKFVFPSVFEGLGIVLIEAQKIGLECVASDAVPDAATVSNLVKKVNLTCTAEEWAEEIMNFHVEEPEYFGIEEWDMKTVAHRLEEFYTNGSN